ncbi:MAG: hypothetical protein GW802_23700, partial [Armatimonadetes bacterium]|nr:hypothetical protein [Armatimonadota bacterium]
MRSKTPATLAWQVCALVLAFGVLSGTGMTEAWAVSVNYADPSFGFDNQSSVDVTFYGSGFHDGMTVKLDKHWHHGSHATLWP